MSHYHIKHITRYTYPNAVIDSANQIMLFPINDEHQEVKNHKLIISHQPSVEVFTDYFGNQVGIFSVIKPHNKLVIQSDIEVISQEVQLAEENMSPEKQWQTLQEIKEQIPFMDFLAQKNFDLSAEVLAVVTSMIKKSASPFTTAQTISTFIYNNFEYKKGITSVETKVEEIWKLKAGVCQDFANILLVMLRMMGIPARYVSGYICPKNHELRGEGATHAWVEAYTPFYGWVGLDPTNDCIVSDRHVRLAIGRNFSDCTPVKGTYKGSSEHTLEVSVSIENGKHVEESDTVTPVFTYQTHNPNSNDNSYRRFMEIQQQQ